MGIELVSVRAAMGRVRAGTNTQEDLRILLAELDGFLPPEPVLPLRDRALRMFTEAPGGMDGYEAALRAIDYVIAEMSAQPELAPFTQFEIKRLEGFIHGGDLGLYWRCIDATLNSFRPARVARAKR